MREMTRMEAAKAGLIRYYTGRPCKHGHDAERFTSTGGCVSCMYEKSAAYREKMKKAVNEGRAA